MPSSCSYDFGPFRFDSGAHVLYRDGKLLPLKDADVLLVLVQQPGRIVTKDELLKQVWSDVVVEEGNLARHVSSVRRVLGDGEDGQRYIETIPKRGYRFVAPVREVGSSPDRAPAPLAPPDEAVAAASPPARLEAAPRSPRGLRAAVLGAAALSLLSAAYLAREQLAPRAPPRRMLAVLPVQNLSGSAERDFIADGLTEELIAQLGALAPRQLGVIARTSSMSYRGTHKTAREIGQELSVELLLEASLRTTPGRLRVTVQLIRASDETHLWAQSYDRDLGDLVMLQAEISEAVAHAIRLRLTDPKRMQLAGANPVNPVAYEAYLKGRHHWSQRTREGLATSIDYYQQALRADPVFAKAYAGLADAYNLQAFYGYGAGRQTINQAWTAARKALELDEALPEAHAALAYGNFMWWWRWPEAEHHFLRAIALDASSVPAHHWYALYLAAMGRHRESVEAIGAARELDPLSPIVRSAGGYVRYLGREHAAAAGECTAALEMDPDSMVAHFVLGLALEAERGPEAAIAHLRRALEQSGNRSPAYVAALGHAYAGAGHRAQAEALLAELAARSGREFVGPSAQATVLLGLGDREGAMESFQKARLANDPGLVWMKVEPRWDPVRSDRRFQAMLQEHDLAPRSDDGPTPPAAPKRLAR
jgi:TolB-like protein/DNA-binding winged helix-turn-helix (wHTH) protein